MKFYRDNLSLSVIKTCVVFTSFLYDLINYSVDNIFDLALKKFYDLKFYGPLTNPKTSSPRRVFRPLLVMVRDMCLMLNESTCVPGFNYPVCLFPYPQKI